MITTTKHIVKKLVSKVLVSDRFRDALLVLHTPLAWVIIRKSSVFDGEWYREQYIGGRGSRIARYSTILHYILIGRKKGLTPSPYFVGEHFDPVRWQISVVDPLVKYLVKKQSWGKATSIIFDPESMPRSGVSVAPLVEYLASLKDGKVTGVYLDRRIPLTKNMSTEQVTLAARLSIQERTRQIRERSEAEPISTFDYTTQQETIGKYKAIRVSKRTEKHPAVSIIMPAWNRETLVGAAIESVQRQTLKDWELIIVDDGSTDGTIATIKRYQQNDDRIKLITPGHGGVCKARNHGLRKATGEWVAFLDSDNTWTKDFLQTVVCSVGDQGMQAGYSAIKMENHGQVRYRVTRPDPSLLETGNYIDLNALVVHKSVIRKVGLFDESLRRMVDYDLVWRISKQYEFVYVPVIGVNYADHDDLVRISTSESVSWDGVVKNKNAINWEALPEGRSNELVSIVVPVRGIAEPAFKCVNNILAHTPNSNVEIIISDASSNPGMALSMAVMQLIDPRIRYSREHACKDTVLAANYGIARSRGSRIAVVNQHVMVESGWLEALLIAIDSREHTIAGPLQLKLNRTIRSAGVEFYSDKSLPVNILENHPIEDVARLDDAYKVEALANGCFASNVETIALLNGVNPLYDGGFELQDLSLRANKIAKGINKVVVKSSQVINPDEGRGWYSAAQRQFMNDWSERNVASMPSELWAKTGFEVVKYEPVYTEKGDMSPVIPLLSVRSDHGDSRRWAIKISAPPDQRRYAWGDMYYANSLASALRKLDQFVTVDYLGAHDRPTAYMDDINIDLRGLTPFTPHKDAVNLLWVISHPDDVTDESLRSFDLVYGAGKKWCEVASERSGKTVKYLPQCTDAELFTPPKKSNKELEDKVLFVGNSRNVFRPIVRDSIAAGLDVSIYGGGWDKFVDKKYLKKNLIPNKDLSSAYGSAAVVLNDHWDDMKRWGFISNRLFDAAASGARIISDDVSGALDIFGSSLYVYQNLEDLQKIKKDGWDKYFGSTAERSRTAATIRKEHSFDARAKRLLEDVLANQPK